MKRKAESLDEATRAEAKEAKKQRKLEKAAKKAAKLAKKNETADDTDNITDNQGDVAMADDTDSKIDAAGVPTEKKSKKDRQSKRSEARSKSKLAKIDTTTEEMDTTTNTDEPAAKKQKTNKKKSKKTKAASDPNGTTDQPAATEDETMIDAEQTKDDSKKGDRFIVFVGNLPYSATKAQVENHFSSLHPISVRLLTHKDDRKKSRGIAFVEFGHYSHMRTCLDKFHHSEFKDGSAEPRKINVELTAGGGGNTEARKGKIQQKNERLNERRARRMAAEEEAKEERRKEAEAKARGRPQAATGDDHAGVHPSRRAQVPKRSKW